MNIIKSFATASFATCAAIALTVAGSSEAEARTNCITTTRQYRICRTDNGHGATDYINVYDLSNGRRVIGMNVVCTGGGGYTWRSVSDFNRSVSDSLAKEWCGNYN